MCCNNVNNLRSIRGTEEDKWLTPPYIIDDDIPQYPNGPSMLIPKFAIPCMAATMWNAPIMPIDDIYTGGILRKACKVPIENFQGFNGYPGLFPKNGAIMNIHATTTDHVIYHLGSDTQSAATRLRLHEELTKLKDNLKS